jgi:hypothetical protein
MKNTSVTPSADLRPDAEAEPQREDRRQHDARQRVGHLEVGVEHRRHERLSREPEAEDDAAAGADDEGEDGLGQRDAEMLRSIPVANIFQTRAMTSSGVEKKNFGMQSSRRRRSDQVVTDVPDEQRATATSACSASSFGAGNPRHPSAPAP